ncbi:MAG: RNA polymerase sigma factor [Chitinophagaceae bacterium]|nr:RNA polymerase sigma factor [Chitinophagaceae bacterium]
MAEAKLIHTDQRYLTGLLQNDTALIREIYDRFSGKVKAHIIQNSGSADDAADIFQESLIDIYQQAQHKNLQLTCPFEPFLFLVCKRKWLNELKKRSRQGVTKDPDDVFNIGEDVFALAEQFQVQEDNASLFCAMFKQLSGRCRKIINKCLANSPQEEVAEELGVSYAYLRKKKSECTAELIKLIKTKQGSYNE